MKIEEMTLEELVAGEKSANIVRKQYEDSAITLKSIDYHDERLNGTNSDKLKELSSKLALINSVRTKIINEMEKRLLSIE
jgi:hypothetical protein